MKQKITKWFHGLHIGFANADVYEKELSTLLDQYRKEIVPTLTVGDFSKGDIPKKVNALRLMASILEERHNNSKVEIT